MCVCVYVCVCVCVFVCVCARASEHFEPHTRMIITEQFAALWPNALGETGVTCAAPFQPTDTVEMVDEKVTWLGNKDGAADMWQEHYYNLTAFWTTHFGTTSSLSSSSVDT